MRITKNGNAYNANKKVKMIHKIKWQLLYTLLQAMTLQ